MQNSKKRLADYIADRSAEAGVRDVFLVTGGGAMHLNDAFARNKLLAINCFHHEQAAAMAAESYFRLTNRLALLNVTTGPGAINALNGVHGAYVDSLAMIIVSGQVKRETLQHNEGIPLRQLGDQEVDIIPMVKGIVKYATCVQDPNEIGKVLDKAFFIATHGRPGPVWIDVPIDVQSALLQIETLSRFQFSENNIGNPKDYNENTLQELQTLDNRLQSVDFGEIINRLKNSKRPVLMVGNGVRISGMHTEFRRLIELLKIPVVTGWNAHDLLEYEHEYYAGKPGTQGDRGGNFTVQNADFLLVLGCRLNIRQISYNWSSFAKNAFKIMVDVDKSELQKHTLNFDIKVNSALQYFIPELISKLENYAPKPAHSDYLEWCKERVERYPVVREKFTQTKFLNPYQFLDSFFEILPDHSVVITGNGSACVMGFQVARVKKGQRLYTNSGSASMGFDLPAAIGASIASNKGPVYCLAGDGSLMMNLQELQTVLTYKLPIKIVILNNGGYSSIRQTQKAYFPDNVFGTGANGDGLELPDFMALGRAFGFRVKRVESIAELKSHQTKNLLLDREAAIIEVMLDSEQSFCPKLTSKKLDDGSMETPPLEDMAPFLSRQELEENMLVSDD